MLLLLIPIFSCSHTGKALSHEEEYELFLDSIFRVDSIFKDSLKSIIGNEAIGNIDFGMNCKEFEKAKQIFMDSVKAPDNNYYIGDTEFYNIYPYFNKEGKLYSITIVSSGVYELYEPEDIYNTGAFVSYLTNRYGLSKDDKKEQWIIGSTIFVRRPANLNSGEEIIINPEGNENEDMYTIKNIIRCTISLVVSNSKYMDS